MRDPQQELEHLRKLAQANPDKRFSQLLRLIRHESFLAEAWNRVQSNKGSRTPGIDGQTKHTIDETMLQQLTHALQHSLYKPQPVRRVYIPKERTSRRALGIPTLRDRIVQAAVAQVLEALYEPIFRPSSYGFRPGRSTIHALRHVARAYRSGATWIIEGDLEKCFDRIPHSVILTCLRKRIKDERFLDLIAAMLKAGVMENGKITATYTGTPQGGLVSPILANIVLHELDCWIEDQHGANTPRTDNTINPAYRQLTAKIRRCQAQLNGRLPLKEQTPEGLRGQIKQALAARKRIPSMQPRQAIYYCRYADDYVVILCGYAKAETQRLKDTIGTWIQTNLGLTQHPTKTTITHWDKTFRFLGYDVRGQRNLNSTRWARLTIPSEAERKLKDRVKQLTSYTQIPPLDLVASVNAQMRGWTQYYRYAHNASARFEYLTGVAYWLTAHYLGRIRRCSLRKVMRAHYAIDPTTRRRALYITQPNNKRLYLWNKPPQRQSIFSAQLTALDQPPIVITSWAHGHSYERRQNLRAIYDNRCQACGVESDKLFEHHPSRLGRLQHLKEGPGNRIRSAQAQQSKWLCHQCHLQHHHGDWYDGDRNRS